MARPKGSIKSNAYRSQLNIPVTDEEKRLVEEYAQIYLEQNPDFVDTRGTATVMRKLLVTAARKFLEDAQKPGILHTTNATLPDGGKHET